MLLDELTSSTAQSLVDAAVHDDAAAGRFSVDRSVFVSDDVLRLEHRQIFDKCWLYLAHVSEVSQAGNFVTREIAGRPLLLTRDKEGQLNCFYNTCSHRGVMVAREPCGSQGLFACPYHGWLFNGHGELVNMPKKEAFPGFKPKDPSLGLTRVEQLAEFKGFVFVCFDPSAPPLVDYLASAADYLAYVADHGPHGMECVGGPQEYSAHANWKMLQENSADGYHGMPTHATYFDYLKARDGNETTNGFQTAAAGPGRARNLGNGHAVSESVGEMPWGRPYARWVPGWGEECRPEIEALSSEIYGRLGKERGDIIVRGDRNLLIFPNLVVNDIMAVTVRTFYPTAPGSMKINSWALAPIGETASSRERRLRNFAEFLGPGGFATPDDVEMLESAQRGYANYRAAQFNDYSRGMHKNEPTKTDELQLRTFWRRWQQLMTGNSQLSLEGA